MSEPLQSPAPRDRAAEVIERARRLQGETAANLILAQEILARAKLVIEQARETRRRLKDPWR
jgi:hypothetical protein